MIMQLTYRSAIWSHLGFGYGKRVALGRAHQNDPQQLSGLNCPSES